MGGISWFLSSWTLVGALEVRAYGLVDLAPVPVALDLGKAAGIAVGTSSADTEGVSDPGSIGGRDLPS